jgi:hypothetical protein
VRRLWFACGFALMAYGLWTLLGGDTNGTRPVASALWAAGAVTVHDGLFAPVVFAAGWLLRRVLSARLLFVVVSVLAPAGVAALLVVPRYRSPAPRQNASVWPPLSTVDVVLSVVAGLAALAFAHLVAARLNARARRSSDPAGSTGR